MISNTLRTPVFSFLWQGKEMLFIIIYISSIFSLEIELADRKSVIKSGYFICVGKNKCFYY